MAPIHRMDMYHDLPPPPPPPPIPLKLKPKTLKKLSQQAVRGPLYLIVPGRPHCGGPHPMQPPPPPHQQSRNYAVVHPRQRMNKMAMPQMANNNSVGSPTSISDSLNGHHSSSMDNHHRFRQEKYNIRPRVQQLPPWMRNGRSKSPANWVRQLTSDDDVEEEDEDGNHQHGGGETGESEARANVRPEYQPSRLVGEIQLSSRVASMTIADVSPRFALKVSLHPSSYSLFTIHYSLFNIQIFCPSTTKISSTRFVVFYFRLIQFELDFFHYFFPKRKNT